jgi:hypothetical protein
MRATVEAFEALLDRAEGPGLLFDSDRADTSDQAIRVGDVGAAPLWIVGDLHVICSRSSGAALIEADYGRGAAPDRLPWRSL